MLINHQMPDPIIRIVTISDTHGHDLSTIVGDRSGDIIIHCGDCTARGGTDEFMAFCEQYGRLPFRYRVMIAGNHDFCCERMHPERIYYDFAKPNRIHYLQNSFVRVCGLKIYGSPYQPRFYDWAFNVSRGPLLQAIWSQIPEDTDILVTHCPPFGRLDYREDTTHMGCEDLAARLMRVHPSVHVFGHCHESYGVSVDPATGTLYVNTSSCNRAYEPVNAPQEITIDRRQPITYP